MSTAALAKKSVKARCCNKKNDLTKLREDLRQRCKLRMREKRQEMLNERRFGVSSDKDVQEKLMKIFEEELTELATTKSYDVLEGTDAGNIKKLISSEPPVEPVTEEEKVIVEEFHKLKEEEASTLLKEES